MKLEQIQLLPAPIEQGMNWTAFGTAIAALAGWLPSIAALFSIVWLGLQIWLFLFVKKPWRRK